VDVSSLKDKRILLIEDDKLTFLFIKQAFKLTQAKLFHASSGEDALNMLANEQYDLILTDIQLPGINGRELLSQIYALHPAIKIVAHTASRNIELENTMLSAGCNGFIRKPYTPEDLFEELAKHLTNNAQTE